MPAITPEIIQRIRSGDFEILSNRLEHLQELVAAQPEHYAHRTGDDEAYAKFLDQFPANQLGVVGPERYCPGHGSAPENFCWWLERGLKPVLGRYLPGSARGHLVYRLKDGSYYQHGAFEDLSPEAAVQYVASTTAFIATRASLNEALPLDDDAYIYAELNLKPRVVAGQARRLRIFQAYHPEIIPINSPAHIEHFLKLLGVAPEDIPTGSFARLAVLQAVYERLPASAELSALCDLSPWGFVDALYSDVLGWRPLRSEYARQMAEEEQEEELNTILYGPPGTGKTYQAIDRAVRIADASFYLAHRQNRELLKTRYDELSESGRIQFVTFHQSYTYEDFVEGLCPRTEKDEKGNPIVSYAPEAGLFKVLCNSASESSSEEGVQSPEYQVGPDQTIWKMSLGNTLDADSDVFDECVEQSYVLLGYGGATDFSAASGKEQIRELLDEHQQDATSFTATAVNQFVNNMSKGDLVIVSEGNLKFRAIGEVTGDYEVLASPDGRDDYLQCRKVRWLRVFQPARPREQLFDRAISQLTIYPIREATMRRERLQNLLDNTVTDGVALPHVLIIDEINRGNISRIFGELITLLEKDKRGGLPGAVQTTLPLSRETFSVPSNLYVIGTMNTADRSLARMDIALRRRFSFQEQMADVALLESIVVEGIRIGRLLQAMNDRIEILYDRDHQIGHTYFLPLQADPSLSRLGQIFESKIFPLLEDYCFEDRVTIRKILGDDRGKAPRQQFLRPRFDPEELERLLGSEFQEQTSYYWNSEALDIPEAYQAIYE